MGSHLLYLRDVSPAVMKTRVKWLLKSLVKAILLIEETVYRCNFLFLARVANGAKEEKTICIADTR